LGTLYRDDFIAAYHRRLFSGIAMEEQKAARTWAAWENALASVQNIGFVGDGPSDHARAFARLENHYFVNAAFLEEDGWILKNRGRIEHISADIVQGQFDMICPPVSAHKLASGWEKARLQLIPLAGHALSEPGISEALVAATDRLREMKNQRL
jgi:proline iminopeptidase